MSSSNDIQLSPLGGESHQDDINIDIEGVSHPSYNDRLSVASHEGLRHRPSQNSAVSQEVEELKRRLPSRVLADAMLATTTAGTWRAKSRKRRPGYQTVRLNKENPRQMASDLMCDEDFLDAPAGIQNEEIRELPTSIGNKMIVKAEVSNRKDNEKQHKKPSFFKRLGYTVAMGWKRLENSVDELKYSTELWAEHMKKIEGHFGSGVTSYFLFIKFLFLLNIPVFILICSFITLPQLLYRYIELDGYNNTMSFSAEQIITGSGWLNETELYYGEYHNGTIDIVDHLYYQMPYAYLCTLFICYIGILIYIALSLTKSYRKNYIEASDDFNFYYVSKVFCGWSFSVDNPESANLKHKSIFKEFQEYLSGFRKEEVSHTCDQRINLFLLRLATNIFIGGLIAGCGYLVWYISITQSLSNKIAFLSEMALPLCISGINFVLPFAFSILASFEKYASPRTELYFTMIRTILLNLTTLGVLIYFWFSSVDCSKVDFDDQRWLDSELECRPCWETFMGENLYRLVIVDFIFILAITFISEFIRRIMSQYCCTSLGRPEFNIGRNTLNLIYSQGLVWLGLFYSPILPLIMIVKLLVIFYVKRFSVMANCTPSVKPWRGGVTHTVIIGLLFVFYLLCMIAFGYSIVFLKPSEVCGPYQGLNASYEVITNVINDWKEENENTKRILTSLLEILTSVAFLAGLFIILCIIAHYSRVVANGHREMVQLLRNQIALEGKDKAFLLKLLQQASQHLPPPDVQNVSKPGESQPPAPGGKQFAKYAVPRLSHTPQGTPTSQRKSTPSGSHSKPPSGAFKYPPSAGDARKEPMPHSSTHNPHYIDQSFDGSTDQRTRGSYQTTPAGNNPGYRDQSPSSRPNLPYPTGQPYSSDVQL